MPFFVCGPVDHVLTSRLLGARFVQIHCVYMYDSTLRFAPSRVYLLEQPERSSVQRVEGLFHAALDDGG